MRTTVESLGLPLYAQRMLVREDCIEDEEAGPQKNRPIPDFLYRSGKPLGTLGRTVQEARRQLRERKFYNLHVQPNPREKTWGSKLAQKRNSHFSKICRTVLCKSKAHWIPSSGPSTRLCIYVCACAAAPKCGWSLLGRQHLVGWTGRHIR